MPGPDSYFFDFDDLDIPLRFAVSLAIAPPAFAVSRAMVLSALMRDVSAAPTAAAAAAVESGRIAGVWPDMPPLALSRFSPLHANRATAPITTTQRFMFSLPLMCCGTIIEMYPKSHPDHPAQKHAWDK